MGGVVYRNNSAGWRELFTSAATQAICLEKANDIAARANAAASSAAHSPCTPYVASADVHGNTAVGHIWCSPRFSQLEASHGCLKKQI